jgi:hypothetical protein
LMADRSMVGVCVQWVTTWRQMREIRRLWAGPAMSRQVWTQSDF